MLQDDSVVVSQISDEDVDVPAQSLSLLVKLLASGQRRDGRPQFLTSGQRFDRRLNGGVHLFSSRESWQKLLDPREPGVNILDEFK